MASDEIAFGSDSFLDVMANMVGILIVLVMVALMRASEVSHSGDAEAGKVAADVATLSTEVRGLEGEVRKIAGEIDVVQRTAAVRRKERDSYSLLAVARERELEQRRQKLDSKTREDYDLRRALASAQGDLDRVKFDLDQKTREKQPATSTKIETYPTPISRTVNGSEVHFQLRSNRIAYVPMEELVKMFEADAKAQIHRLEDRSEIVEHLGPLNGFRMRYTLEREDVPVRTNRGAPGVASRISFGFTLIPTSDQMGETIEQALSPHSEFRDTVHDFNPKQTTVTLWTYPDSFSAFRSLKKELYLLGYAVAGRPLPEGQPIGASSQGSKSSAE